MLSNDFPELVVLIRTHEGNVVICINYYRDLVGFTKLVAIAVCGCVSMQFGVLSLLLHAPLVPAEHLIRNRRIPKARFIHI